ncbi:nucleotidyltransferase-like protein [Kribbella amoyensis]|uniref:Nucleotidyltransferase-like protein n=1 Tax=Kribbella amoyensis TaxID=996641 RepID=A0A561BWZ4_9ACTN|nr:nucleotidyltransferase domain-containing protein [Kribbella amoyensis]TWD83410.1 nucleotidyltransferase-like protein [Kribbella amoyensis]
MSTDDAFLADVTSRLAALPAVEAVALGGSRAVGNHRPDSDWDFAIYYRGPFSPGDLRAIGWPGEVSELGGWGGGIFNGGAWLTVDGRRVDVHYRDLDDVEHQLAEARAGRFGIERLMFHLAGVPTYIVVAELALNQVLHRALPRPEYPELLKQQAGRRWRDEARLTLDYARTAYAARGLVTETAGAIATAACMAAHGVLASRGEWVTNEKRLLERAGFRTVDSVLATDNLTAAIDDASSLLGLTSPR